MFLLKHWLGSAVIGWSSRDRLLAIAGGVVGLLLIIAVGGVWFASQLGGSQEDLSGAAVTVRPSATPELGASGSPSPSVSPTLGEATQPLTASATFTTTPTTSPDMSETSAPVSATVTPTTTVVALLPTPTETPETPTESPTPTMTISPPSTATLQPTPAPGVYVSRVRINPAQPKFGMAITFIATFSNTTKEDHPSQWFIQIFDRWSNKSVGQTSIQAIIIRPGTSEFSVGDWKLAGAKACAHLHAEAWHLNEENKPLRYVSEKGEVISHEFDVCP